ncbi:MAG: hypothetical protein ACOCWH_00270 [Spirochaetota bacterium]
MSQPKDSEKKKSPPSSKNGSSGSMEGRVKDYLYNPDSKEKIEPPKEEEKTKPPRKKPAVGKKKKTNRITRKSPALHIAARVSIIAAKILFLWVPLTLISLVFAALIVLKAYLSPSRVQTLAMENFNRMSNASLSLDVRSFNPYTGFVIENIVITQPEGFGDENLVSIQKLVLDYGFFSIFTGDVSFREIGIYSPQIRLIQKDGSWNVARLMKESVKEEKEPLPEEEPRPEKEPGEPRESINLPISVNFLFNFILQDLDVTVDGEDFDTSLASFDTEIQIDIPPTKEIPLGPQAINLIKTFAVRINPDRRLQLAFDSEAVSVSPPLLFSFDLLFSGEDEENRRFHSSFIAGTTGTPVRFQETDLKPLSFTAGYELSFDPVQDDVTIDSFDVMFAGDSWLSLGGKISSVTSQPTVDITMKESAIVLGRLYPYYVALIGDDSTRFSGTISLKPLTVSGTPTDLKADGALSMTDVSASVPDFSITIPQFALDYDVLYSNSDVSAETKLSMERFVYKLGREHSGLNNLYLDVNAETSDSFTRYQMPKFAFRFHDSRTGQDALSIDMTANVQRGNSISADANISSLVFRKNPLINMVPASIGESMQEIPLERPVTMTMDARYSSSETTQAGTVLLGFILPDYDVYDLRLRTDASLDTESKLARLNEFRVWSQAFGVNLRTHGFLDLNPGRNGAPFRNSDVRVALTFAKDELRKIYDTWELGGKVQFNARMRGDLKTGGVQGTIDIDNLNIRNQNKAQLLHVEDVNMNFPYEYSFAPTFTGKEMTAADKTDVINNQHFMERDNFTIESIKAVHPARPEQYEYLKDLRASMAFRSNAFTISRFKATVMNGSIYMRDTFFYIADLNPDNMEYSLAFDATNISIGKLDNPDKETGEAELSLTTRLSGKGVNIQENPAAEGYVTIYKIGDEFANELMQALSKKEGESKLGATQFVVDNTMNLDKFIFHLEKGNVYTTIKLERKFISRYTNVSVENDEIKYERIPIQEFLRNIGEGDYQ